MSGGRSFLLTPMGDSLFRAQCVEAGWKPLDETLRSSWQDAGVTGVGNEDVATSPPAMPRFRYGRQDGEPYLTMVIGRAVYSRRGNRRVVTMMETGLPQTLMMTLEGRNLGSVILLTGIDQALISKAETRRQDGIDMLTITLQDATDKDDK